MADVGRNCCSLQRDFLSPLPPPIWTFEGNSLISIAIFNYAMPLPAQEVEAVTHESMRVSWNSA
jgi:hypothetical protein